MFSSAVDSMGLVQIDQIQRGRQKLTPPRSSRPATLHTPLENINKATHTERKLLYHVILGKFIRLVFRVFAAPDIFTEFERWVLNVILGSLRTALVLSLFTALQMFSG